MDRWLLVGALWTECAPLVARLEEVQWRAPRLAEGRLGGARVAVLAVGVGQERAERRTAEALRRWPAERVVSFGTAGALDEDLRVGDLITGCAVGRDDGARLPLPPLPGLRAVAIASVRKVVCAEPHRLALRGAGFGVCEMECAGVVAAARDLPVYALKVVSDRAGADADPALPLTGLPSPLRLARFQLRAATLVHRRLAPALLRCLLQRSGHT